jgi:hypothetical protein
MFKVPFRDMPGFLSMNQHPFEHLFYENRAATDLYEEFKSILLDKKSKKIYFPIMRMCDGEYIFCVGRKRGKFESYLSFFLKMLFTRRQITSWGETYSKAELNKIKLDFVSHLKIISNHGLIANHYLFSHTGFCEEYIKPMILWYQNNSI